MDFSLNLAAKENACGIGVALIIFNLISVFRKEDQGQELVNIILGIWLILSPYALNFYSEHDVMVSAVVIGMLVIILAAWQMFDKIKISQNRIN